MVTLVRLDTMCVLYPRERERERECVRTIDKERRRKEEREMGVAGLEEVDKVPRVVVDVSPNNYQVYLGGKSITCQWRNIYRNQTRRNRKKTFSKGRFQKDFIV